MQSDGSAGPATVNLTANVDIVVVARATADIDELVGSLAQAGAVVTRVDDAASVARAVVGGRPDVVVVDLRRDDGLGDRILTWVCSSAEPLALVITDTAEVDDRIRALNLGAADHLEAPFAVREGVARILRLRARRSSSRNRLDAGDLSVDFTQQCAVRNGEYIPLTPRELDLLTVLVERSGRPVSKRDLLAAVWGGELRSENVVEQNVSSLRRKLHALGPPVIHTVHRSGYVFRPVPPSAAPRSQTGLRPGSHGERAQNLP